MASQAARLPVTASAGGSVPRGGQALALATLCTLLFLTFLDNTVVSVALGDIQVSLKANVADLQWVVGAYALTFASIMLACGMIGDELGRKKVMLAGAGVFCAGSVLCALAPNVQTLIAGPRGDGPGRGGQRARHPVHAAPSVPGRPGQEPGRRHLGGDVRVRAGSRPGRRRRAHRGVELARHLLVQPGVRAGRAHRGGGHPAGELRPDGGAGRHGRHDPRRGRAGLRSCSRSSTRSRRASAPPR